MSETVFIVGSQMSALPCKRAGKFPEWMNALPAAAVKPPITSTCRKFGVMVWHLSSVLMRLAVITRRPLGTRFAGKPPKKSGALLAVPPNWSPNSSRAVAPRVV